MLRSRLHYIVTLLIVLACTVFSINAKPVKSDSFASAPDVAWTKPGAIAMNNVGPVAANDDIRRYDCTPLTYRMLDDLTKKMRNGCFVTMAFGLLDPNQSIVIFNGTDEAEPIRFSGQPAALSALPYSGSVARFGGFPGLGSYMYLYTSFLDSLEANGTILNGRYKNISSNGNFTVSDSAGQPLAVNPLALGYAARGQWMVTESPSHSLIRVNLATFSVLPFAVSFDVAGKPYATHEASMAITESGRYTAVASNEFETFKLYDLKTCSVTSDDDSLSPQNCQSHDYWSYIRSQVSGTLKTVSHVRFVDDDLISFDAFNGHTTETYLLSPDGQITSLIPYLGMGDSYASGQGAFNYLPGTDTTVNRCHLSARSYPLRLSGDIFSNRGHSVACSGARINDVGAISDKYTGQTSDQRSAKSRENDGSETTILHDFVPGYLAQQQFVANYRPGVITVQAGGNDIGFGDILLRCVSPLASLKNLATNPNSCYESYEDRLEISQTINQTYGKWVQLYNELKRTSPASRIYVIGYPQIISGAGECGANVHLTTIEQNFTRDLINYINGVIQKSARAAGVQYIDVSNAFHGYELCSGTATNVAVNGVTAGTDAVGVFGQESFHPTAFGHELLEQAILKATRNFAVVQKPVAIPTEPLPVTKDDEPLLQAPRSGRTVRSIIPAITTATASSVRGGIITLKIDVDNSGFRPNTNYSIKISDAVIGTARSDEQGTIHSTVTVPATIDPGIQPISVDGPGQSGNPVTVIEVIYVHDSPEDYDGDGIPNNHDSCPLVVNVNVDQDHDNLDDACDSSIAALDPIQPADKTSPVAENVQPADNSSTVANTTLHVRLFGARSAAPITLQSVKHLKAAGQVLGVKAPKNHTVVTLPHTLTIHKTPLSYLLWYIWLLVAILVGLLTYICRLKLRTRSSRRR